MLMTPGRRLGLARKLTSRRAHLRREATRHQGSQYQQRNEFASELHRFQCGPNIPGFQFPAGHDPVIFIRNSSGSRSRISAGR